MPTQEICLKCGSGLKSTGPGMRPSWNPGVKAGGTMGELMDFAHKVTNGDGSENLNFSPLPAYYRKEFEKIYDSNEAYKGRFNIWGFLFGIFWALNKGLWLSVIIAVILSLITYGAGGVVYWFIYGFRGTYMYYNAYVKGKQKII